MQAFSLVYNVHSYGTSGFIGLSMVECAGGSVRWKLDEVGTSGFIGLTVPDCAAGS